MSSVFLSFGQTSGFLTGQCLNSMIECVDMPPTWYTEYSGGLLPNAVFYDNAKSVHLFNDQELNEEDLEGKKIEKFEPGSDSPVVIPRYKPTPFIEYVKKGGPTMIPLNQPRPDFKLDECEINWSDIVNFNLSRRSFYEIPGTDMEPLRTYQSGIEKLGSQDVFDEMTDPIRRCLESIDRAASFIITFDRNNGYGAVFSKMSEYLIDEAPKATRISFSIGEEVHDDMTACCASLSTSAALEASHLHSVFILPPELPPLMSKEKFKADNLYHRVSLYSIPFTSLLLPMLHNVITPRSIVDIVAPTSILKFASVYGTFPYFDPMTPFSFNISDRIYSRYSFVSGIGAATRNTLIDQLKPEGSYFYKGVGQDSPYFVGLTMPHFFNDGVLTMDGQKPTVRPPGLNDADWNRLVTAGVIKVKEGVDASRIRILSSIATLTTSRSLAEPLQNAVRFIKDAPAITHSILPDEAEPMAEVIANIIDGINEPDE